MAKEMMIVFVYDTLACTAEEDDPADAVLYFHPGWVSDTQRHALAGQVVGAAHCVKSLFSQPLAITLQSGKFIIREYGRYILAIGSDRNIPDWVLTNRADLLTSMIRVYHGDLACLAQQPRDGAHRDKLYQMLETYLPQLQYGAHCFQRVPALTLPRTEGGVFMEAMQVLEYCRRNRGVLGGIILYNNKIVATQIPPGLTSYLAVVDPYRIKCPAEPVSTVAPLPLGAQLLAVYVGTKTYESLKRQAETLQQFYENGEEMVAGFRKNEAEKEKPFPQTGMKRDKSLLFTAVPEEDHTMISPPTNQGEGAPETQRKPTSIPDVVPFNNRPRPRPNKLSLSFKTQQSVDEETKENEKVFTGQTSVCSTPMVEYKRLHGNVLSICQNPDTQVPKETEPDVLKNIENCANYDALEREKKDNKMSLQFNCIGDHYINKPAPMKKPASVIDIQESMRTISNRATSKFKLKSPKTEDDNTPTSPERMQKSVSTMTINDPSFPVFREDGKEISESLFKQYLEQHYASMKQDLSKEDNLFTFNMKLAENKFEGFDSEITNSPHRTPKKKAKDKESTINKTLPVDQSRRKSLSLPLKSLSESSDSQIGSDSEGVSFKKKLSGVQLTPLMEKLTHLAFSDKSSGYSSRVMTPLELREFTPSTEKQTSFADRSKPHGPGCEDDEDSDVDLDLLPEYSKHSVKTALFVCGLQNMALLVLVEMDKVDNPELINNLWETSLNALGPIEHSCMAVAAASDATDYSYLTLEPAWGAVHRGGRWASLDLAAMGLQHAERAADPLLKQIATRTDDSVVLGSMCGGAEVYYQENSVRQPGPPAPSDALAAAPNRAKRRLMRDLAVVLL
ncbi:uncharacterized protein LOC119694112 [Plutella xylostella]|uniref:uncharacterized protein LOC119694112 n=1 Tax=Plutella xylostella TaxID=51655 RepID=UPI002032E2AE|nr:uncharacterized protein LOC119694112 [Plutella xylostella]